MAGRWRELFGSDEKRFQSRLAFGQSHAESFSANVARENAPGGEYFNGLLPPPEYGRRNQAASTQRRECTPMTTRSFALARLRRHREAFLDPRLPERRLAGGGSRPPHRRNGRSGHYSGREIPSFAFNRWGLAVTWRCPAFH